MTTFLSLGAEQTIRKIASAALLAGLVVALPLEHAFGQSKIAVTVNKSAITTNDIKRRAAFFKLRRIKGNHRKLATDELIEESLKMQEARRLRLVVGDKQVNEAYGRFAKRNKMPLKALNQIMARSGVTVRGFKQFIRAQMSWQRAVSARLQVEARGTPTRSGSNTQAQRWLIDPKAKTKQVDEFTIQQVVFLVPAGKRKALLAQRRKDAKNFRNRMNGCTGTKSLAKGLKNVSVVDRGRVMVSQLPDRWRDKISSTPVGKVTPVVDTEKGVEMIAICKSRQIKTKANELSDIFADGGIQKAAGEMEKKYIAELRKRAKINRR